MLVNPHGGCFIHLNSMSGGTSKGFLNWPHIFHDISWYFAHDISLFLNETSLNHLTSSWWFQILCRIYEISHFGLSFSKKKGTNRTGSKPPTSHFAPTLADHRTYRLQEVVAKHRWWSSGPRVAARRWRRDSGDAKAPELRPACSFGGWWWVLGWYICSIYLIWSI